MVALVLVAAACGTAVSSTTTTTTTTTSTTTTTMATTTTVGGPCSGNFTSRGPIARIADDGGDAANVTGVISEQLEGCDRTTILLSTASAAPATGAGPVSVEWVDDLGVVRVRLGDVQATAVSDQVLESLVLDRLYVVRGLDGSLFVDLITSQPSSAQARVESDPARVVIELIPSPDGVATQPVSGGLVVVTTVVPLDPDFPLTIEGYSRTFEANVLARIDGELVGLTTAADWVDTWGEFILTIESGPDDPGELFIGEDSPRDGEPVGVTLALR